MQICAIIHESNVLPFLLHAMQNRLFGWKSFNEILIDFYPQSVVMFYNAKSLSIFPNSAHITFSLQINTTLSLISSCSTSIIILFCLHLSGLQDSSKKLLYFLSTTALTMAIFLQCFIFSAALFIYQ